MASKQRTKKLSPQEQIAFLVQNGDRQVAEAMALYNSSNWGSFAGSGSSYAGVADAYYNRAALIITALGTGVKIPDFRSDFTEPDPDPEQPQRGDKD